MPRFVIDAQLPPALAERLTRRGYPSEHVARIGLRGSPDEDIWKYAIRRDAALMTKDEDFVALVQRSPEGPPVVWIRLGNITNRALWSAIERALDEIIAALDAGERLVEVA